MQIENAPEVHVFSILICILYIITIQNNLSICVRVCVFQRKLHGRQVLLVRSPLTGCLRSVKVARPLLQRSTKKNTQKVEKLQHPGKHHTSGKIQKALNVKGKNAAIEPWPPKRKENTRKPPWKHHEHSSTIKMTLQRGRSPKEPCLFLRRKS